MTIYDTTERTGDQFDHLRPHFDTELVARATALIPLIREHAAETSEQGFVAPAVMAALDEAELLSLFVPHRYGGHEASMRTSMEVLAELAKGDGSTAWAASLLNVCTWFATTFSAEAQDEVFGTNPRSKVAGIFTPGSTMTRVDGGYLVSGRWPYSSGSFAADWAALGIAMAVPEGEDPRALALFSRDQFTIERTWFVTGMKGSGSDTIVLVDQFVPDHRVQRFQDMREAQYLTPHQAEERNSNMAFIPVAALVLIAPQLGLARHALELTLVKLPGKSVAYTRYTEAKNSPAHQFGVAAAATKFRLAELLAGEAADLIDHRAILRELPTRTERAQIRNDTGVVAELVKDGLDLLLTANGAGSFAEANVLSRIWRDAEIAGRHAYVTPEVGKEVYGRVLLGADDALTMDI
ncbi:acyl-CoA dehydrogenase family protein [Herbiconiux sp. CPCC 203407]|uniref:Acyl-CoA dehydrogenase family protein n=1 Tax=Herbiconiux oxytropis TaxID=2970915 RepID=A0AA41XGG8_9MICO|nr:acyl-CoA dehydrogenase family protein [Herbiconiux oxytropis]MCS5722935.1 acyl-CoA dehydrogenase family protein [Herbiconiux oxytropis]MCS5725805.1 acyl-CoA dehydrogenase family protein [Herbiconiux oxytropis]